MKPPLDAYLDLPRKVGWQVSKNLWKEDREDLEGELSLTLVKAYDAWDPARGASLSTWLNTALRNRALNWLRDFAPVPRRLWERRGTPEADAAIAEAHGLREPLSPHHSTIGRRGVAFEVETVEDPRPTPLESALQADYAERLWRAVRRLAPNQQRVIALYVGLGMPYAEMQTDRSIYSLHHQYQRGLRALRKTLEVEGFTP